MKDSTLLPATSSLAVDVLPTLCPACRSSSIVTTAKTPDAGSYWRCTSCGEVWNASRSQTKRPGGCVWR